MWKLIFLGLLIWLGIYLVKRLISPTAKPGEQDQDSNGQSNHQKPAENMVQCATCHVHLPRSEAFLVNGRFYCCQAHIENK